MASLVSTKQRKYLGEREREKEHGAKLRPQTLSHFGARILVQKLALSFPRPAIYICEAESGANNSVTGFDNDLDNLTKVGVTGKIVNTHRRSDSDRAST